MLSFRTFIWQIKLIFLASFFVFVPTAYADVCAPNTSGPNLYQVTRTKTQATLSFTPLNDQIKSYTIIYGLTANDERYSVTFLYGRSPIGINYTINNLDPAFSYFFKIRANNTCGTYSPWSNWVGDNYLPGGAKPTTLVAGSDAFTNSLLFSSVAIFLGLSLFSLSLKKSYS